MKNKDQQCISFSQWLYKQLRAQARKLRVILHSLPSRPPLIPKALDLFFSTIPSPAATGVLAWSSQPPGRPLASVFRPTFAQVPEHSFWNANLTTSPPLKILSFLG